MVRKKNQLGNHCRCLASAEKLYPEKLGIGAKY
jgi:hypothetical protein